MLQQIKSSYNGSVLFECEAERIKECLVQAVSNKANLCDADLRGAYLRGADLRGANLCGADLRDADLREADLREADLREADLRGADLEGADLEGEVLTKAPILILNLKWDILITNGYMRIGCQRHTHAEWKAFDGEAIAKMESNASEFWAANKEWLLATCESHAVKDKK